jgi:NAD(P)-dependent dehydrogenase (short-subunit alcohol dehydrogenase family)
MSEGDPSRRLVGKVAVVTGASRGFGRAVATAFAHEGARVVGVARTEEAGRDLEVGIEAAGGELVFVPGDVRRVDDCRRTIRTAVERFGRIDILVNNAGTAGPNPVASSHEVTEDDWDDVLDTNLKGAFFCSRFALEDMVPRRDGVILNLGSINGVQAVARMPAYNASKAALLHLSNTLAVEYSEYGIRSNAIVLGGGPTPTAQGVSDAMARVMRGPEYLPPRRPATGTLDEFGRLLVLLCTDDARLITGAVIAVDRGISAGLLTSTMIYLRQGGLLPSGNLHLLGDWLEGTTPGAEKRPEP